MDGHMNDIDDLVWKGVHFSSQHIPTTPNFMDTQKIPNTARARVSFEGVGISVFCG